MTPEHVARLREAFDAIVDLPPDQRETALGRIGVESPELLVDLEPLLAASRRSFSVLDEPGRAADLLAAPAPTLDGNTLGPYLIVRLIAEGGMGAVYEAERADDVFHQRVAIKVCKQRIGTDVTAERFARERRILARLEHPNIARILDGGTLADQTPYFVLEFVDGLPIDDYVRRRDLGLTACLRLFLQICGAVAYAHRNLIVHRDLKPANVLVTADGTVKLLDFGIAKLLEADDAGGGQTRTVARVMTPAYAAPEQIRGAAVTTATDVYALGVLLYELLTGRRPHDAPAGEPWRLERAVVEDEPDRASAAAARDSGPEARRLRLTPAQLRRQLRGDLDRILLRALDKDPDRRYATAGALAAELTRFLDGEPVAARGDHAWYRAGKFVRRHRAGVAATALAALSLMAGLVATTWQARVAAREARQARAVQEFLVSVFAAVDPGQARGRQVSARELLDAGAQRIDRELGSQPEVRANLSHIIGTLYMQLGEYDRAQPLLASSLDLTRRIGGGPAQEAATLDRLALVAYQKGRFDEAVRLGEEAVALARGATGPDSLEMARYANDLAWYHRRLGQYAEAARLRRFALDVCRTRLGADHPQTLGIQRDLATLLADMGQFADAETLARGVLDGDRRALGDEHPETLNANYQLSRILVERGRYDEAAARLRDVIPAQRRVLGAQHDALAQSLRMLAWALDARGDYPEAARLTEEALAIQVARFGPRDAQVAVTLRRRAEIEGHQGNLAAAERDARESLDILQAKFGDDNYDVGATRHVLAWVLLQRGRIIEAQDEAERALAIRQKFLGTDHLRVAETRRLIDDIARHR